MKKKIFALLLSLCMVLTMMPSMGFADTVTLGVYANLNDRTPITDNAVNNLNEFYVIANYTPKQGENVEFYTDSISGISGTGTQLLENNGKPYIKIIVEGSFSNQQYNIRFCTINNENNYETTLETVSVTINKEVSSGDTTEPSESSERQLLYVIYEGNVDDEGNVTTSNWENAIYIRKGESRSPKYFGVTTTEPNQMQSEQQHSFTVVEVPTENYDNNTLTIQKQNNGYEVTVSDNVGLTGENDEPHKANIDIEGKSYRLDYCVEAVSSGDDSETDSYEPLDKTLLVCTSNDGGTNFTPIPVEKDDEYGIEYPAQYFLENDTEDNENGTFYVLYKGNANSLNLPILDGFLMPASRNNANGTGAEITVEKVYADEGKTNAKTVSLYDETYSVWKVTVSKDFDEALRVGFSFRADDSTKAILHQYNSKDGGRKTTKFMWILGRGYFETPETQTSDILLCDSLPTNDATYSNINAVPNKIEDGIKHINLSANKAAAAANTFYVLYPQGTTLSEISYKQSLYENNGKGMSLGHVTKRPGGGFCQNIGEIYAKTSVNNFTVTIGSTGYVAQKMTLKNYYGHEDILSVFSVGGNQERRSTTLRLAKGMDIAIEGNAEGVAYLNANVEFSQEKMEITPDCELEFTTDNRAFYPNACAEVNEEGRGTFIEMNLELESGYVLEKITNGESELAYIASYCTYYQIYDKEGKEIAGDSFWELMNGELCEDVRCASNEDEEGNSIGFITLYHNFASSPQAYRDTFLHGSVGKNDVEAIINMIEQTGYSLEPVTSFTSYAIYFNPENGESNEEIVFHVKKAESTGSDFSAKNNGRSVSDGAMTYDRLAADSSTKTLLKNNLTKIGTKGYEILDVYDMKRADGNEASGLYNITIPASKFSGVDPTKCKVVYYADNNAVPLEMETTYTTDAYGNPNGIVFTTGHFSNYAIIYEPTKSSGGSSGGYVAPTTDAVTNKTEDKTTDTSATTTATVKNTTTTAADGTKTVAAKVDTATADKIVEKAVENKSAEVVVDAATAKTVTETAAGTKTEVTLPATTVSDIANKTDAAVTIKADAAEIKLDKEAVKAVAEAAGAAGEVKLQVETVTQDENKVQVDLKLVTSNGNVSDFKGGNVSVTVKLNTALAAKPVVCVYIDAHSTYHKVGGQKNADGTFTFKTGHFSSYAVMAEEEADKVIAEQTAMVEKMVKALSLKARSAKTAKGYIKVNLTVSEDEIKAIEALGYTVKYKFYRSTKKAKGYKAKLEGTGKTYTNTTGKKGTKYYYKARVMVYDAQGEVIAKSALTQCRYASRTR